MAAITTTGTLTAGNSRTFALAPGSALTLTLLPNCRVTVTETPETVSASDAGGNSPRTHNHQFAGVFTYGPYVMGGSVVVDNASNSGSTVTWGRKDTTVSTSSDGLSLVDGAGNKIAPVGALDIRSFGAASNGQAVHDAAVTGASAGSMTIASASALFTAADVGKRCAHLPKTNNGNYTRYGTITAVNSANSITVSLNGITTGTNQTFVWGTDDSSAIDLALSSASALKIPVFFPSGITVGTRQLVVPTGVTIFGVGNVMAVGYARDFEHYNSCLVALDYVPTTGGFVKLGNNGYGNTGSNTGTRGCQVRTMTIDGLNLVDVVVGSDTGSTQSRSHNLWKVTMLRGTASTYNSSASSVTTDCVIIQQQRGNCAVLAGDSRFTNNYVYGSGATYAGIKCSGSDVLIAGNHIWKDADTAGATGPSILLDIYGGITNLPSKGGIIVRGNQFDTSFGPHIQITVAASTYGRAVTISDNIGFQNDQVPNATYPCIDIDVAAGGSLRALTVTGNAFQGSWNDNTKGQYTAMIDGAGIVGTVIASSVVANVADNCAALYASFTPTYSAGNHTIAGAVGTTVTSG